MSNHYKGIRKKSLKMVKKGGRRNYQTNLIIGGKGQGKSSLLREIIDEYYDKYTVAYQTSNYKPRVFVHDMSSSRAFSDIPNLENVANYLSKKHGFGLESPLDLLKKKDTNGDYFWKHGMLRYVTRKTKDIKEMYQVLGDHFKNGLVVLDEWTSYVRKNPPDWQIELINNHRNFGLEVFIVCHQLMSVPPFFVRGDMVSNIILFKTGEKNLTDKMIKDKYSCADKLLPAYRKLLNIKETSNIIQPHFHIKV